MQSRRDQAQAQSYLMGRLTSALVTGELDSMEAPHRRTVTGFVAGILVAALVAAGFTMYGLFVPGGSATWRQAGTLIVEKETGTRYLYAGGLLRPVLNYVSAKLLLGADMTVTTVSANSLAGTAHGQPVGIVGAPDTLPTTGLTGAWWTACAPPLMLGITPDALGTPETRALPVTADGTGFLIWNGHRYRMTAPWVAKVLGYAGTAVTVPAAWLDLVPAGPDLGPLDVPGRGSAGPAVDGRATRVGQLFTAGDDRYYVLLSDGLATLTATAYGLLAGDPRNSGVSIRQISPAGLAGLPTSTATPGANLPAEPPPPVTVDGYGWCLRTDGDGNVTLIDSRVVTRTSAVVRPALGVTRTASTADAVAVEPGLGGLVADRRGTTFYLVTDSGTKYPLASTAVAKTLGYDTAAAAAISPGLLDLLPTGPLLGPAQVTG